MIIRYKTNHAGPYHIDKGIPCQDSYALCVTEDGCEIAAVADGLGSAKYSKTGSQIAVDCATTYCKKFINREMSKDAILEVIKNAFIIADSKIIHQSEREENAVGEYDTTLCLVVYIDGNLYYGNAGDSGILGLAVSGDYIQVTKQQRDEDGYVYPLSFGENYWEFDSCKDTISAFLLMTDGVYEQVFPPIMANEEVPINIALAEQLLGYFEIEKKEEKILEAQLEDFWINYPSWLLDDDKTTVGILDTSKTTKRKADEYYLPPNWELLKEKALSRINIEEESHITKNDSKRTWQEDVIESVKGIAEGVLQLFKEFSGEDSEDEVDEKLSMPLEGKENSSKNKKVTKVDFRV